METEDSLTHPEAICSFPWMDDYGMRMTIIRGANWMNLRGFLEEVGTERLNIGDTWAILFEHLNNLEHLWEKLNQLL